jgi:tRNA 2-thiouridine synthesizing protein A
MLSAAMLIPELLLRVESAATPSVQVQVEVDARALMCPMPLLKAKQALRALAVGESIRVIATDAGSLKDFVSYAQIAGQHIESFYTQDEIFYYVIRKQTV